MARIALLVSRQNEERGDKRDDRSGSRNQQQSPAMQIEIRSGDQGDAHEQNVDDGQRDKEMPAQAHQLVKAISRDREAQPHEKINVETDLENEPEAAVNSSVKRFRHRQNYRQEQD